LIEGRPVPKSDVFALANTLYAVLTGDDPSDHPYQWLRLEALTDSLASILEDAMALDASKRLDATQFGKRLSTYVSGRHGASARPTSSQDPHV
jgi:hypothetical protein